MIIKVIVYNNFLNVKKIFSDNFFFYDQIMQSFVKSIYIYVNYIKIWNSMFNSAELNFKSILIEFSIINNLYIFDLI